MEFESLKGKTLTKVDGAHEGSEEIIFYTDDGCRYMMHHIQDCCEDVEVEEVIGNLDDMIGEEILVAYEESHEAEGSSESGTWTFYTLRSNRATAVIRWLGESNGYYSEEVDFCKLD